jgi:LPS-assembly protein
MLKFGAWLAFPLLLIPAPGQDMTDPSLLPDLLISTPVDTITPVPSPALPPLPNTGGPVPKELDIENLGGTMSGNVRDQIILGGPVKITGDNGLEIFADTAVIDLVAKSVTLTGNVAAYEANSLRRGHRAVYYYERKFLDTSDMRASMDPVILEAGKFTLEEIDGEKVYVGTDGGMTTHDYEKPNFWLRAKKTRVYPNKKIVFNNLKVYAGDVPVFWLPYLSQPLHEELGYHFLPGTRSNWGPFLLNSYGIMLGGNTDPVTGKSNDGWLLSRWRFDLYSERGIGTGLDLIDKRPDTPGDLANLSLYYLNDIAPETTRNGFPRDPIDPERYRANLQHRKFFGNDADSKWRADTQLSWLSDQYYLGDFSRDTYSTDPYPDNTFGIFRQDDSSLLSFLTRFRINDFYRADTRLPEITFDQARGPRFGLPLLHEGTTSLSVITERAPDTDYNDLADATSSNAKAINYLNSSQNRGQIDPYERRLIESMIALPDSDPRREDIRTQLLDSGYARFHTYQEFSLPRTYGDFFSVTPQAGVGYSAYEITEGNADNLDRATIHAGVESAFKISKDYGHVGGRDWGLNGLLHIVQPYSNISVLRTNDYEPGDPSVDHLSPSTRPQPLDPLRFTAIDELQSWEIARLGVRNRLLTRRDNQSMEWLFLDTYIDAFLNEPEGERNLSNLYNDLRWQPLPWLGTSIETQMPIGTSGPGFTSINSSINYQPVDWFECSLGFVRLDQHPYLTDTNRVTLRTYTSLSENWGFGTQHTTELDDNVLELQQYTIHHNLGNWVFTLGLNTRDNRFEKEYGAILLLTLKDLPMISLPLEMDAGY